MLLFLLFVPLLILLCLLVIWEFKMPTVTLSIFAGVGAQLFDNNGIPLSGGKLFTYEAGTNTPLASYTSSSGSVAHANPIILDSAGRVPGGEIWLDYSELYKFVVKTSTDITIATYDNVGGSFNSGPIIANFTGDGVTVAFTLASSPASENSTNVYIQGVYQQKNTYAVSGTTLTFSESPPTTSSIEVSYT
jgi:hypothetical protein